MGGRRGISPKPSDHEIEFRFQISDSDDVVVGSTRQHNCKEAAMGRKRSQGKARKAVKVKARQEEEAAEEEEIIPTWRVPSATSRKVVDQLTMRSLQATTINGGEEPTSSSPGKQLIGVSIANYYTEMIIPHVVQDAVRKRFFSLKSYCFGVHVNFKHSHSMMKSPTLILSAEKKEDMNNAMIFLNDEIEKECTAIGAPRRHHIGCVDNLGFLGGVLSSEDYNLLFFNRAVTRPMKTRTFKDSAFRVSFEKKHRCAVSVQAADDNRDAYKIYFGAPPHKISVLWGNIQTCLADCKREGKLDNHQAASVQTTEENDDGIAVVDGTNNTTKEKKKDSNPNAPRNPSKSSFAYFFIAKQDEMKAANPNATIVQIVSIVNCFLILEI